MAIVGLPPDFVLLSTGAKNNFLSPFKCQWHFHLKWLHMPQLVPMKMHPTYCSSIYKFEPCFMQFFTIFYLIYFSNLFNRDHFLIHHIVWGTTPFITFNLIAYADMTNWLWFIGAVWTFNCCTESRAHKKTRTVTKKWRNLWVETGKVSGWYFQILARNAAIKIGPWCEFSKDVSILNCESRKSSTQSWVTWCVSLFSNGVTQDNNKVRYSYQNGHVSPTSCGPNPESPLIHAFDFASTERSHCSSPI